jgi:hypothetical protein
MDARKALQELAAMIKAEIMRRVWEEGVNPKTGTNTLISSDLIKNMTVEVTSDDEVVFTIADYYTFVVLGWRRTGRWGGGLPAFVNAILKWMRKKNVHSSNMTDNSLAWAIVKNIFEGGIMARPFINYDPNDDPAKVLPFLDKMVDTWMDDVFDLIIQEIDKNFT